MSARTITRRDLLVSSAALLLAGCGSTKSPPPTPAATALRPTEPPPTAPSTRAATPIATPAPVPPATRPIGFPLDPSTRTGRVTGTPGNRTIAWGAGSTVLVHSRDDQPSADAARANACGWNARTHFEYEGQPAIDWYVSRGTPVLATMDGTATLLVNTVSNPFDVYRLSREPYIGDPDRPRAPISPFPGPGGGQGTFVRIENDGFRADHAHLDLAATLPLLSPQAFLAGYSISFDFATAFAPLRDFRVATAVARWAVRRGDVIGMSGDSGYSEAPHLHYAISRLGVAANLCPTLEPGFDAAESGWLLRS